MSNLDLIQEVSPTKLGAAFNNQEAAERALEDLCSKTEITRSQVNLVKPADSEDDLARKLEPEQRNIGRTLLSSHIWLGAAGLLLGFLAALMLVLFGPVMTRSSPLLTFIALIFFGGIIGLLLAGLVSLRPDHDPLVARTKEAAEQNNWTVVVHCRDHDEVRKAKSVLEGVAERVTTTA